MQEVSPTGEKNARIRSTLQPRYANMSVFHTNNMKELELELVKFPNAKHDDIIDSLS
jgi:phage terminase large subunit-like protein